MPPSSILIVDDEPVNHRLIRAVLGPQGYTLHSAHNGEEALELVHSTRPDLILMDVVMPKSDGFEVCKTLKQNLKTKLIPIILLTSLNDVDDKIKGVDAGADDYLTKPFHSGELTSRVRSLLALKHYTDELENASEVLRTIASVVEQRDAYTGHHCQRVGDYGAAVALALGLTAEEVKTLRLAGLFHDLGKIAIPDQILRKPGPLTADEMRVMRSHPKVGAELVYPMASMSRVIPLIRHHHERLDGSGYPEGLTAKKIPMVVRILSVVDIYDALATERPYKKALPPAVCLQILRDEARRGWWDLDVVNHLERALQLI